MGNISHLLKPTYPTVHLPNGMLRIYPQRGDHTESYIHGLPIIVVNHRENCCFNLSAFQGYESQLSPVIRTDYDNEQIIIVDDDGYLIELLGRLGIKIDAEAFKNGDCVVFCDGYTYANYCLNNYSIPSETDSDEVFLLNIPEEVTIKSGDTLYFDCYAGSLTATVGAKLSYADVLRLPISFSQLAGIYFLDDVAENGGFMPHDGTAYHVIASKAFAERLAAADGNRSSYKNAVQYHRDRI